MKFKIGDEVTVNNFSTDVSYDPGVTEEMREMYANDIVGEIAMLPHVGSAKDLYSVEFRISCGTTYIYHFHEDWLELYEPTTTEKPKEEILSPVSETQLTQARSLLKDILYGELLDEYGNRDENGINHYPNWIDITGKLLAMGKLLEVTDKE
jgi:hypothetical protein